MALGQKEMLTRMADGRESLRSGLKELEKYGLLKKVQIKKNGKFSGKKIVLMGYEALKTTVDGFPVNGDSVNGTSVNGKSPTNKTNTNNTNKNKTKEREEHSQKSVNAEEEKKIKNFMDLKEWIENNAHKINTKKSYEINGEHIAISQKGILYKSKSKNLSDLGFKDRQEALKEITKMINNNKLTLDQMLTTTQHQDNKTNEKIIKEFTQSEEYEYIKKGWTTEPKAIINDWIDKNNKTDHNTKIKITNKIIENIY